MSSECRQKESVCSAHALFGERMGRVRLLALVSGLAALWCLVDVAVKAHCNSFAVNEIIVDSVAGLLRFRLVHNTGAAWGIFSDSTFALGVLSVVVCVALMCYAAFLYKDVDVFQAIGIAMVVGGGIGNAIDRFTLGYVVDFIEPTFIDFPVFNIADIGVTCGLVIFLLGMFNCVRKAAR